MNVTGNQRVKRWRLLIAAAVAALIGGAIIGLTSMASAAESGKPNYDYPALPKSQLPANINSGKKPILDPPNSSGEAPPSASRQEQIHEAEELAAQDPGSTLICYATDGSVAGVAMVNRVDERGPIIGAAEICSRGWPGSHP